MVETEMSIQSEKNLTNATSSYSKIETNENCYIDPKDIKLGIYTKDLNDDDDPSKEIPSAQLLPISIEQKKTFFYKKIGNTYTFFGDIYGDPKLIIGPHWPLYLFVTSLFTAGTYLIYSNFGKYLNFYLKVIGIIIYFIFLISYTYTVTINPGFPKHDIDSITGEPRKKFYYCNVCKIWANLEKKTQHCPECNICIEGNDHHCPWTGKCIGKRNHTSFIIFVCSVFVLFVYLIILIGTVDKSSFKKNDLKKKL